MIYLMIMAILGSQSVVWADHVKRYCYPNGNYILKLKSEAKPRQESIVLFSRESADSGKQVMRKGTLVLYPNAKATLVISHGFMCEEKDARIIRQLFPKGLFNFITYDMRAHGENKEGQICSFGKNEAYDVMAAAQFARKHPQLKKLPVLGYGFSMGAAATIEAQAKDPNLFTAIALDCPFDSTENLIKKMLKTVKFSFFGYEFDMPGAKYLEQYAFHPYVQEFIKFLLKTVPHMDAKNIQTYVHRFSPSESVKKITVPCFFIHCKNDSRVSIDAVMNIYNGARGPKRMWLTNGRWHYDSVFYNPEKYGKKLTKFFESVLDKSIYVQPKQKFKKDPDII